MLKTFLLRLSQISEVVLPRLVVLVDSVDLGHRADASVRHQLWSAS